MNSLKEFNSRSLLLFTENDRVLAEQLLSMSLEDIPDFYRKSCKALSENRLDDAIVWIHKIKGIAGTVGAEILYDICRGFEEQLKSAVSDLNHDQINGELTAAVNGFCNSPELQDWISDV
ncbi:MAG: Hpt domain-containing protein [Spirochaetales bacterium]|nr:Hpt domain-containing protein [Spirochaetales bacterium]